MIEQGLPNFTNARQGARRLARRTLTALTGLQELNAKPTTQRPHDVVRTVGHGWPSRNAISETWVR